MENKLLLTLVITANLRQTIGSVSYNLDARKEEILTSTERILQAINNGDWEQYCQLTDPNMTAMESDSLGNIVVGLDFHKFYFENATRNHFRRSNDSVINTTILNPHITLIGENAALIAFIRLTQYFDKSLSGPVTVQNEETRVWQRKEKNWQMIHLHRSLGGQTR